MLSGNTAQDTPTQVRLGLQQRAPATLRRHVVRAARRFVVLFVADLASFWVMRELLRSLRDFALFGTTVADGLQALSPRGILNGWQFAAALVVGLLVTGTYGRGDMRRDPRRLFFAAALATALPLWMTIWGRGLEPVVVQYTLTTVLVWGGLVAERLLLDRLVAAVYPPANHAFPTLFVGPAEQCREAMATTAFTNREEFRPVGFVDVHVPPTADARGHITDFSGILHETGAETVVVCGYLTDERFQDVVDASLAAGCQLLSVPRSIDLAGVQPTLVWRRGQPLIELTAPSLKGRQLIVKRIVDMVGAATILLLASPLMLLAAVAVKLDSPGPVLFGQERLGIGGRRFRVLKFRTMTHGASDAAHRALIAQLFNGDHDAAAHPGKNGDKVYKLVNDDRVTRIGALLRRTSLDELPQLFNVLRGDMSLVGPRPPLSYEFEAYDHWQYDRHRVKPGITGLWQVSGRNLLTYQQMCELDVRYVREWSLWLDVKILFRTIPVVFANSGRAA
jgi:exopolysaccharide biosynthesis polyprenyl glycosylphosphotransferase